MRSTFFSALLKSHPLFLSPVKLALKWISYHFVPQVSIRLVLKTAKTPWLVASALACKNQKLNGQLVVNLNVSLFSLSEIERDFLYYSKGLLNIRFQTANLAEAEIIIHLVA